MVRYDHGEAAQHHLRHDQLPGSEIRRAVHSGRREGRVEVNRTSIGRYFQAIIRRSSMFYACFFVTFLTRSSSIFFPV